MSSPLSYRNFRYVCEQVELIKQMIEMQELPAAIMARLLHLYKDVLHAVDMGAQDTRVMARKALEIDVLEMLEKQVTAAHLN